MDVKGKLKGTNVKKDKSKKIKDKSKKIKVKSKKRNSRFCKDIEVIKRKFKILIS